MAAQARTDRLNADFIASLPMRQPMRLRLLFILNVLKRRTLGLA
jgi:hypothetical protein